MQRDDLDLHAVRPIHIRIHERLLNWARWSRASGSSSGCQPMFKHYRAYAFPESSGGGIPVDTVDAVSIQKLFARLPEKHRWAVQWSYCFPFISPFKVCRVLAVSRSGLVELVHDGRTMLKNQAEKGIDRAE